MWIFQYLRSKYSKTYPDHRLHKPFKGAVCKTGRYYAAVNPEVNPYVYCWIIREHSSES